MKISIIFAIIFAALTGALAAPTPRILPRELDNSPSEVRQNESNAPGPRAQGQFAPAKSGGYRAQPGQPAPAPSPAMKEVPQPGVAALSNSQLYGQTISERSYVEDGQLYARYNVSELVPFPTTNPKQDPTGWHDALLQHSIDHANLLKAKHLGDAKQIPLLKEAEKSSGHLVATHMHLAAYYSGNNDKKNMDRAKESYKDYQKHKKKADEAFNNLNKKPSPGLFSKIGFARHTS